MAARWSRSCLWPSSSMGYLPHCGGCLSGMFGSQTLDDVRDCLVIEVGAEVQDEVLLLALDAHGLEQVAQAHAPAQRGAVEHRGAAVRALRRDLGLLDAHPGELHLRQG